MKTAEMKKIQKYAPFFAALGDEIRLSLVMKLSNGKPQTISELVEGFTLTRQAITKHLRILEKTGYVHSTHSGRNNFFEMDLNPFQNIREYLDFVSKQWDNSLSRLRSFVENE